MVQKFAPLVKRQLEYWLQQIDFYPPGHPRYRAKKIDLYRDLVRNFTPLLDYLNSEEGTDLKPEPPRSRMPRGPQATVAPDPSPPANASAGRNPTSPPEAPASVPVNAAGKDELLDLPPELLAELSDGAKAETDPLIQIINKRGGTASLDDLLIDLYRLYGEVNKRTVVGNKLYRLARRELCWPIPGRKGIYTTTKPANAEGVTHGRDNDTSEDDEGPDAATSEPSNNNMGAAGSPEKLASTPLHRKLMSETSAAANQLLTK